MARKPMVTRTMTTSKVSAMCVDITNGETYTETITLPRTYKNETLLMKKVKEVLETETLKPVHVVDVEEIETLYGMTEEKFIENAEVLPPRGNVEA